MAYTREQKNKVMATLKYTSLCCRFCNEQIGMQLVEKLGTPLWNMKGDPKIPAIPITVKHLKEKHIDVYEQIFKCREKKK